MIEIKTHPTPLLAGIACALWVPVAACATDHIEANAITVSQPSASDVANGLASFNVFTQLGDRNQVEPPEFYVHLNGLETFIEGELERVTVEGNSGLSASIEPGTYVVELLDSSDTVVLRTRALNFAAGRANSLFVHGDYGGFDYIYSSGDWADLAEETTVATFGNATKERVAGRLDLCTPGVVPCTELAARLEYGSGWTGRVGFDTRFVFVPDVIGAESLDIHSFGLGDLFLPADDDTLEDVGEPGDLRYVEFALLDWTSLEDPSCAGCAIYTGHGVVNYTE